jgi:V/A-type H+-transporting ATPase subunit E
LTLDAVIQAIQARGKAEVDQILAEARAERERMLSDVRIESDKGLSDAEARAREAAERRRVQDFARAELEARKIVLAAQKEDLDEVYQRALARLSNLKENPGFLRMLLKANEAEWKTGGKVYSNARDEAIVRGMVGKAYAGHIETSGGLIIESADGSRRVDLRYESILQDVWNDSVREVAEILWPSRKSKA